MAEYKKELHDAQNILEDIYKLKESMHERYYTRIPNKDFDDIIGSRITKQVEERFKFWLMAAGLLITLLGGILAFTAKQILTNEATDIVHTETDKKFKSFEADFDKKLQYLKEFQLKAKKSLAALEFDRIKKDLEFKTSFEKAITKLEVLLGNIDDYKELVPKVVDELIYQYYRKREKLVKIDKLLAKYNKDYELLEVSWVNAALGHIDQYEAFGSEQNRQKALDYLDRSLYEVPGYGEALGLKLVTLMVGYDKADNGTEKSKIQAEVRNVFKAIKQSSSISAYETIRRLDKDDKKGLVFYKYVELLYKIFPNDLKEIRIKAKDYGNKIKHSGKKTSGLK